MPVLISTEEAIKEFKTAICASALSAGLILLILLLRHTAISSPMHIFETIFFAFSLGVLGASVYVWLAAKCSFLGRVTRTNLVVTLKALAIVLPLATVLSLVRIALRAPQEAQVWISWRSFYPA